MKFTAGSRLDRNNKEFGRLLSQAVQKAADIQSKKVSFIQDELGNMLDRQGGTAIAYWRQGHVPDLKTIDKLVHLLVDYGALERISLLELLSAAGYPYATALCDEMFPQIKESSPFGLKNIPTTLYREFTGRQQLIQQIMSQLSDPDGRHLIGIDGIGGIGKTALAHEIVMLCRNRRSFNKFVWISAATNRWLAPTPTVEFNFETILQILIVQMGYPELLEKTLYEQLGHIRSVLRQQKTLLVLDNLETASGAQEEIIESLAPLLDNLYILMTSRRRFLGGVYAVHVTGLESDEAVQFLHREARDINLSLQSASTIEITRIFETTGGMPQALKLIVGQLGYLKLDTVLHHLANVQPLDIDTEFDEYLKLYRYIYFPSWNLLSQHDRELFVSMAAFIPGIGGEFEAIQHVSKLPEGVINQAIHRLWRLSLLEVRDLAEGPLNQRNYYLHSLTKHFILSDITNRFT